jgi:pimeloyl-ACP methyl ester carboxylesterase
MLRLISLAFAGAVVIYLAVCVALFFFQRSMIYHPQPLHDRRYPTFELPAKDARVLVTARDIDGPRAVIYFGGNGEDSSGAVTSLAALLPERAIYALHYRGYGGSSGAPSESALFQDALALLDHVQHKHARASIIGRSLGSGVAVYLASRRPVERLVLVTPYDSVEAVAEYYFPYVPVRWILRDKFESWKYAPQVSAPTLILAAERDEVIPRANTERLVGRFEPGVTVFKVVPGMHHNTPTEYDEYQRCLGDWLR